MYHNTMQRGGHLLFCKDREWRSSSALIKFHSAFDAMMPKLFFIIFANCHRHCHCPSDYHRDHRPRLCKDRLRHSSADILDRLPRPLSRSRLDQVDLPKDLLNPT